MTKGKRARAAFGAAALAAAVAAIGAPAEAVAPAAHPASIDVRASGRLADAAPALTARLARRGAGRRGTAYGGYVRGDSPYPVALWLNAKRTAITKVVTAYHADCTAGLAFNLVDNGSGSIPIKPDGSFTIERTGDYDIGNRMTASTTVTVRGRVKGRTVSGTAKLHVDEKDAAGTAVATCDVAGPYRAKSSPGRVYAGASDQDGPVVVELRRNRSGVRFFRLGWQSTCDSGAEFQVADSQRRFPIGPNRRFGDEYDSDSPEGAEPYTDHYVVRGKVRKRKVSGTFRVTTEVKDADGNPTDACDSGLIEYTARSG